MTDAQAQRFVTALDKVDAAILALRDEFQALADRSAQRLTELKAQSEVTQSKAFAGSRGFKQSGFDSDTVSGKKITIKSVK